MDFGSTYVYLGPSISDVNVASGIQPESAKISALTNAGLEEKAEALAAPLSTKVGATLTYKDAVLDIKNVYNLTEHVVDWFGLGTQLEITDSRLKKIRLENETEDGRRREMIVSWLYGDPEASWQKLSKALVRIDHRVLANKIDREILLLLQHGKRLRDGGHRADSAQNQVQLQHAVSRGLGNMKKGAPLPAVTGCSLSLEPKESATVNFVDGECDADSFNPPPPKRKCEDKVTNILMIKFGALSKPCKVHTGDPVICSNGQCAAILNYRSKITKETGGEGNVWICEFCSTKNTIEIEAGEIPKEGDILYLQQPQHSSKHDTLVSGITKDSIVVFCVDTSGSMGVTTEVPGYKELKGHEKLQKLRDIYAGSGIQYMPGQYKRVTYISRLQCVQAAIDHQLTTLARNNPSQRVAIVMFGDEVTVTGDGKPENEFVFVGEKLWKENAMLKLIENIPSPSPIKQTQERLREKIFSIEEEGQTALGGALLASVEIARRAPGSKVILCTDGLANRGVGNLDDQKSTENSIAFYRKLGMTAKESSVSVSVLTIKGTECDLLHLGQVANLSGGNVDVVDPMSLTEEFVNILSTSVVAVRANAKIILHSTLCFKDGDAKSTLSIPVGNVVDTTKLMYEFSSSKKNEADNKPQEVPFQVQIKYTSLDGQQCLRVFTEVRPVTSDKRVANKGAISSVLNAHRLQESGNYILGLSAEHALTPDIGLKQLDTTDYASSVAGYYKVQPRCIANSCTSSMASHRRARPRSRVEDDYVVFGSAASDFTQDSSYVTRSSVRESGLSSNRVCQSAKVVDFDMRAAAAFKFAQGIDAEANANQRQLKLQKCITLTNEGYGFGFLVSAGKESGTVVQSLIPNGVAWKDGKLRKGDKLLTINGENVENMAHQDVVKKLRLLNEEATNSITLCVAREEEPQECQILPQSQKSEAHNINPSHHKPTSDQDAQYGELISVNLQSDGSDSLGLTFRFDGSEQLIIEEIISDGIADKDCRLKVNDIVLEINGEAVSGKTNDAISVMMKDIEDSNGLLELLVRRGISTTSGVHHKMAKSSHRKPNVLERLSSWYQSWRSPQEPNQSSNCLNISLHNQGYGFGFTVQETEDKSIVVSTVFPEGVAHNDGRLRANDKLVEINGRKVSDMTYKEVITMLRALNEDDHSIVDLKVERKE